MDWKKKNGAIVLLVVLISITMFVAPSLAQAPAYCSNNQWDKGLGELGVDCGDVCALPCPPATPLSCNNLRWDVGEEWTDCGGICSIPCPLTTPSTLQIPSTCSNGIKDSNEEGVDCGPVCNKACPPPTPTPPGTPTTPSAPGSGSGGGRKPIIQQCPPPKCVFNWTTGNWSVCIGGIQTRSIRNVGTCPDDCETDVYKKPPVTRPCVEPASCFDSIKNQDESDVDCGGICVAQNQKCKIGQLCAGKDTNCWSEYCDPATGRCATKPTCDDKILNQGEVAVDCGGPCQPCSKPPSCTDGIRNGDETGVDCGGSCQPCAPTCYDGIKNGGETDIDCGGPCVAQGKRCDNYQRCNINEDCKEELTCTNGICSKKEVIVMPLPTSWWGIFLAFLWSFWWIILLAILLIILALAGYHYYETHNVEEIPLPPSPVKELELPPFPVVVPVTEEVLPPLVIFPTITAPEKPLRQRHYRELLLPLYIEKEKYKQILEDMPLLSSMLLKKENEIFQDMHDIHHHKSVDIKRLRDDIEEIYKRLTFMDHFLFEEGKKRHRVRFEE